MMKLILTAIICVSFNALAAGVETANVHTAKG